jgi:hypothetical protein
MLPEAEIVHALPGRARLRVAARRRDAEWLAAAAAALRDAPGVEDVTESALTGSLLVRHRGELEELVKWAETRELFRVLPARPAQDGAEDAAAATAHAAPGLALLLDPKILRLIGERLAARVKAESDPRHVAAAVLALLGAVQMARGQVLPAAVTLLNEAFKMTLGAPPAAEGNSSPDAGDAD